MFNNLGYTKPLFILPFDHRSSFTKIFQDKKDIISAKWIIYEAFKKALSDGISKDEAAILVDEEFGDKILIDAKNNGITTILTTEKSGQKEFTLEYGKDFGKHIEKYNPTFVKALVRYKPNADWAKLKMLSDYCHSHDYKFLLEVLSGETISNPKSLITIISELRQYRIEPDVWKLEGMENKDDYKSVVQKIKEGERTDVGLVILGRAEVREKVEQWINAGKDVGGVTGFAVGRTVFWQPLVDFKNGKISKEETTTQIANNFKHFYDIFRN